MNPSPDERPVLDYSKPAGRGRPRGRGRELLVVFCIVAALGFALKSYIKVARRWWTPAYAQYRIAQERQQAQPGYIPPPFVGRRYEYESVWEVPTTYLALIMVAAAAGIVTDGIIKSRRSGHAG
jgi:hypothetical protein